MFASAGVPLPECVASLSRRYVSWWADPGLRSLFPPGLDDLSGEGAPPAPAIFYHWRTQTSNGHPGTDLHEALPALLPRLSPRKIPRPAPNPVGREPSLTRIRGMRAKPGSRRRRRWDNGPGPPPSWQGGADSRRRALPCAGPAWQPASCASSSR